MKRVKALIIKNHYSMVRNLTSRLNASNFSAHQTFADFLQNEESQNFYEM